MSTPFSLREPPVTLHQGGPVNLEMALGLASTLLPAADSEAWAEWPAGLRQRWAETVLASKAKGYRRFFLPGLSEADIAFLRREWEDEAEATDQAGGAPYRDALSHLPRRA